MTPSDGELIAMVIAGKDQRAFSSLVTRYQSAVRAVLMRLCRNAALADDLAQETFIKAYNKISAYSGAGSFKAWLCRIAYNEFLMSARKRKAISGSFGRARVQPAG